MSKGCSIGRTYPAAGTGIPGKSAAAIARTGGGSLGTLSNWSPRRLTWPEDARTREKIADRANDIAANNAHGASLVDSIAVNTVGTGLWPQARPNWKRLGISEEAAQELAESLEWEFEQFSKTADASSPSAETATSNIYGVQFQNIFSFLVNGEFLNLPLMINDPSRRYSLALQVLDPVRLRTPLGLSASRNIRDGIRLGDRSQPAGYFIADPEDGRFTTSLDLRHYRELPPNIGHRPVVFHRFHKKFPEDVRGRSILAPAMKFFRDISDYLDFELVGAIVAASFPVFIQKTAGYDAEEEHGTDSGVGDGRRYQEVAPGSILYGNAGEEPKVLSNRRPGNSFATFVETILRGAGAAAGMPYEVIAKDFSKTNYSSARAALEEAWRVFGLYQDWLITYFCQPVYEMFVEEAWLRGYVKLPKGAPDFYQARAEYCACTWIVPERTNLDPVKEMVAAIMGKNNNIVTDAEIAAKRGKDWEGQYTQRSREMKKAKDLGLPEGSAQKPTVAKKPASQEEP